jgi:hypothetical protein
MATPWGKKFFLELRTFCVLPDFPTCSGCKANRLWCHCEVICFGDHHQNEQRQKPVRLYVKVFRASLEKLAPLAVLENFVIGKISTAWLLRVTVTRCTPLTLTFRRAEGIDFNPPCYVLRKTLPTSALKCFLLYLYRWIHKSRRKPRQ